jgi:hypothetical protein
LKAVTINSEIEIIACELYARAKPERFTIAEFNRACRRASTHMRPDVEICGGRMLPIPVGVADVLPRGEDYLSVKGD